MFTANIYIRKRKSPPPKTNKLYRQYKQENLQKNAARIIRTGISMACSRCSKAPVQEFHILCPLGFQGTCLQGQKCRDKTSMTITAWATTTVSISTQQVTVKLLYMSPIYQALWGFKAHAFKGKNIEPIWRPHHRRHEDAISPTGAGVRDVVRIALWGAVRHSPRSMGVPGYSCRCCCCCPLLLRRSVRPQLWCFRLLRYCKP